MGARVAPAKRPAFQVCGHDRRVVRRYSREEKEGTARRGAQLEHGARRFRGKHAQQT